MTDDERPPDDRVTDADGATDDRATDDAATDDQVTHADTATTDRVTDADVAADSAGAEPPTDTPGEDAGENNAEDAPTASGSRERRTSGQPAGRHGGAEARGRSRRSWVGLATAPLTKRLSRYAALLFGGVGVGLGAMFLVLKYLGRPPVTSSQSGVTVDVAATQFVNQTAQFVIYLLPLLAAALAALLGVRAVREHDAPDRDLTVAAGIASLAGTLVLVVVASLLVSFSFGTASAAGGQQVVYRPGTVALGNVAQNAVAYGIGAGVVGALTAYTTRNYA